MKMESKGRKTLFLCLQKNIGPNRAGGVFFLAISILFFSFLTQITNKPLFFRITVFGVSNLAFQKLFSQISTTTGLSGQISIKIALLETCHFVCFLTGSLKRYFLLLCMIAHLPSLQRYFLTYLTCVIIRLLCESLACIPCNSICASSH